MPNLKTNQSISDYNEKAQRFVQELKAFLHIEHKSNPKFNNRHLGKFLCPVVDFHHFTERKTWAERISLFGFPVVKNDDSMLTCIIFDDVNRLQPVINTRVTIHGKKPTADEVTHAFQEVQKFLASKAVTNRICQGPNFIRVQTVAMAATVTTFLSTNEKLRGFKFERHGEDIFMSGSPVEKVDVPVPVNTGAQNGTETAPDPNEDFINRVITEIFGVNIYATDYSETGSLILGFDGADIAESTGVLCNEYGLECVHKIQTLLFERKEEYPFSYEDIKECYSKKSAEVIPAAENEPENKISEAEFYEQIRQFVKENGGSLRKPKGGCTRISSPYVYSMDIIGIDLDLFIRKALVAKPNWKIEKGRKGGWLKFSLIMAEKQQPAQETKPVEESISPIAQPANEETGLVTIAVRMPLPQVLMQIPDDELTKELEIRRLQPVFSNDDVMREFEKRNLLKMISDANLTKEFKERGLISDDELKKMVKERGPVFAGALLQTLLEK